MTSLDGTFRIRSSAACTLATRWGHAPPIHLYQCRLAATSQTAEVFAPLLPPAFARPGSSRPPPGTRFKERHCTRLSYGAAGCHRWVRTSRALAPPPSRVRVAGEVHGAGSPGAAPLARGTMQRPGPSPGRARASHTLRAFRSASYRHVWPTTKNTGHACGGRSCCAGDRAPVVLGSRCMMRNQGAGRTSVIKWH